MAAGSVDKETVLSAVAAAEGRIRDDIASMLEKLSGDILPLQRSLAAWAQSQLPTSHGHLQVGKSGPLTAALFKEKRSQTFNLSAAAGPHLVTHKQGSRGHLLGFAPSTPVGPVPLLEAEEQQVSPGLAKEARQGRWEGWPGDLYLREELILSDEEENIAKLRGFASQSAQRELSVNLRYGQSEKTLSLCQRFQRWRVLHPTSRLHIAFDMLCMIVIFVQIIYLPFALVWTETVEDIDRYVLLGTAVFWFLDLCLRFLTGYYNSDGEVELQLSAVMTNYLRTWFAPDFLCVVADVVNYVSAVAFAKNNAGAARIVYLVKIQRILRAVLMLRMLRVAKLLYNYMEGQLSATWLFVIRTWQFATLILWLAHVVACAWYEIGRHADAGLHGSRWVETIVPNTEEEFRIQDTDVFYQYMTSYHWSLAQITLGGLDINPCNSWERSVAIACNFFGLFFGGMVVSILSTTLMELRELNHDKEVKMRRLREFLLQHGMAIGIRLRVIRQVSDRMQQHGKTLVEEDVLALKVVSSSLLKELRYHLYYNLVRMHPLLHCWTLLHAEGIRHLCSEGVTMKVLLPDDELFTSGSLSTSAYLVKEGRLTYTQQPSDAPCCEEQVDELVEAAWVSEATWWCHWYHVGTAVACNNCTLLVVPPEVILESMDGDPVVAAITIEYGIRFHGYIVNAKDSPVTDANVQYADFNGLLCTLPTEVHVILGMAALQQLVASGQHWRLERNGSLDKLKKEVAQGGSLVMMDYKGNLHRRVATTALQLESYDGDVCSRLTQVAYFDANSMEWKPSLNLPVAKQKDGEDPQEAMRRILAHRLLIPSAAIVVAKWVQSVETHSSKHFGVGTHYIKTTGVAQCDSRVEAFLQHYRYPVTTCDPSTIVSKRLTSGTSTGNVMHFGSTGKGWYSSREELPLSQIDCMYVVLGSLAQTAPSLYVWMTTEDSQRLSAQEHLLTKFLATLVASMDDNLWTEIANNSVKHSFELSCGTDAGDFICSARGSPEEKANDLLISGEMFSQDTGAFSPQEVEELHDEAFEKPSSGKLRPENGIEPDSPGLMINATSAEDWDVLPTPTCSKIRQSL